MKLLYTGANKQFEKQDEPNFSLGGFISSSEVPEDNFSALFGEITVNNLEQNLIENICVVMFPTVSMLNINFSIITDASAMCKYRVAVVKVSKNDCEKFELPKMKNIYSKPVNLSYHNCTSVWGETKIIFNNIAIGTPVEIYRDFDVIASGTYTADFGHINIEDDFEGQFEIQSRFNFETKLNECFLIQKNLVNFSNNIEAVNADTSDVIASIENTLPKSNFVGLGNCSDEEVLALYIERSLKNSVKNNSKTNCENLFQLEDAGVQLAQVENIQLEIDYEEEVIAP